MGSLTHTVSGDIASFRTPSRVPIESLKFHFLPKQASGTPSPENPIPIEGWTGLNGEMCSETLFNYEQLTVHAVGGDSKYAWNNGKLKLEVKNGTSTYNVLHQISLRWDVPVALRGKNVIFFTKGINNSNENHHAVIIVELRRGDNTLITDPTVCNESNNSFSRKVTLTAETAYCIIIFRMNQGTTVTFSIEDYTTFDGFYANYPNVITENPEHNHRLIPITFPDGETIYGGYVDPIAGEIVAEYEILEGLWGDWPNLSDQGDGTELRYKRFTNPVYGNSISNHRTDYCNVAKYGYTNANGEPHYYIVANSYNCRMYLPSGYDTTQNVQVIGKLITPIHIPIPAKDMKAFLDHNNFWSDVNDVTEVTYPITESKDILATRKRAITFDHAHHKKVKWNQWAKEVSSLNWRAYNTTYASLTFNNGVGTRTTLSDVSQSYTDAVRSINECAFNKDHKYYIQQDLKASKTKNYVTIIGSGWKGQHLVNADTWTTIKSIGNPNAADDGKILPIWACYSGNTYSLTGETCQFKNTMFIDLTQMFGVGNEPVTVEEFERICAINNINLTTYQPYDEGSDRWLIIP